MRTIFLFLLITSNTFAMSFERAESIYNKITRANGFWSFPKLKLKYSGELNERN